MSAEVCNLEAINWHTKEEFAKCCMIIFLHNMCELCDLCEHGIYLVPLFTSELKLFWLIPFPTSWTAGSSLVLVPSNSLQLEGCRRVVKKLSRAPYWSSHFYGQWRSCQEIAIFVFTTSWRWTIGVKQVRMISEILEDLFPIPLNFNY